MKQAILLVLATCLFSAVLCFDRTDSRGSEVFGFSTSTNFSRWESYDFSTVTTIVALKHDDDTIHNLVHLAHSHSVKVFLTTSITSDNLHDAEFKTSLMSKTVDTVLDTQADGLYLQFDGAMAKGSSDQGVLNSFIRNFRTLLHKEVLGSLLMVEAPWSPECIEERCYDFLHFANNTDYMYITGYHMRSQVYDSKCAAGPNSDLPDLRRGIREYTNLGIPGSKMVLGVAWYGYDYTCKPWDAQTLTCFIPAVEYRGAPCSDSPGKKVDFAEVIALRASAINGTHQDNVRSAQWFTYENNGTGIFHMVWYDDQHTLPAKVTLARQSGFGGVGVWTIDGLYDESAAVPVSQKKKNKMWAAVKFA